MAEMKFRFPKEGSYPNEGYEGFEGVESFPPPPAIGIKYGGILPGFELNADPEPGATKAKEFSDQFGHDALPTFKAAQSEEGESRAGRLKESDDPMDVNGVSYGQSNNPMSIDY